MCKIVNCVGYNRDWAVGTYLDRSKEIQPQPTMAEVDSGRNCPSDAQANNDPRVSKLDDGFEVIPAKGELTQPQITKFVFVGTTTRLPNPAPPPKLHFSTWWRKVARRIFQADHKRRVDANRKRLLDHNVERP